MGIFGNFLQNTFPTGYLEAIKIKSGQQPTRMPISAPSRQVFVQGVILTYKVDFHSTTPFGQSCISECFRLPGDNIVVQEQWFLTQVRKRGSEDNAPAE